MVEIKGISAKAVLDSRKEKTISVYIKTNVGSFSASAPNGKSKGKHEAKSYKKSLDDDIKQLKKFNDYFLKEEIEKFGDLRRIEDIVDRHIGANTLFAFESAILKALAKEQKKEIWQLINPKAKLFPRLVGNCIGGGKHSASAPRAYPEYPQEGHKKSSLKIFTEGNKKPDFQEFLLVPNFKDVKKSFEANQTAKKEIGEILEMFDKKFKSETNDENAWKVSLNDKEVLDVLKKAHLPVGLDVAASSFYKRKNYNYANPMLRRTKEEQLGYLSNLIKNFKIFYIEDPFEEEDFESFAKILKRFPESLIVGDDLIVTNYKRLQKAIESKSVNAIIVKPNQCGSLLEVSKVCELAKENNIKLVFSHRSGETNESILADLAFGFQADFFKCGINGKGREIKLKRLIEIEESLK
ncbi:MAG: hypothetical protein KJ566_02590 [Nanoarchaeota archaeon]|nr:hypothetical protein [Nanoarchaeota archaeon]